MTVTPQGDGVPLQPAQGEQRQGNRGHLPPYTRRKTKKNTIHRIEGLPPPSQPSPRRCTARRGGRREEEEGEESL